MSVVGHRLSQKFPHPRTPLPSGEGRFVVRMCNQFARGSLLAQDALLVKVRKRAVRIVARLEGAIGVAAIDAPERLAIVVALRVERLDAAQAFHLALDQAIEVAVGKRLTAANDVPEAEVSVQLLRPHRVEAKV